MVNSRDAQAIDAAKLYYVSGLSQAEVAQRLGVSRPTVSKLLQHARDEGFVMISLHDPREGEDAVVNALSTTYGLESVRVVRPASADKADVLSALGSAGADMVEDLVRDGMSIGLSWGNTMNSVAEHLRNQDREAVTVVQLKGGHSHTRLNTNDLSTLTRFARAFNAEMLTLPLPVIFDSATTKKLVEADRHVATVMHSGANADMAVFTVGDVHRESLLLNLGYLSEEEIESLMASAVGDVCSRFFDAYGRIADERIDARTVGITLEALRSRPIRVMIAGGKEKVEAIRGALSMGMATHLVIDHATATRVVGEE